MALARLESITDMKRVNEKYKFWWKTWKYLGSSQASRVWSVVLFIVIMPLFVYIADVNVYDEYGTYLIRTMFIIWGSFAMVMIALAWSMNDRFCLFREIAVKYICFVLYLLGACVVFSFFFCNKAYSLFVVVFSWCVCCWFLCIFK